MNEKRVLIIIGIVAAVVVLVVVFDTILANHRPLITSLEAEPEIVHLGGSCQIVCIATDGDELTYEWSASGGGVSGQGATITWTAPDSAGFYDVTVTVSDGRGGEAVSEVTIEVRPNSPPTISSLIADTAWAHPSGSIQVTCNATDPDNDELSYEWSTTGGNITGTGAVVTWTAPPEVGTYNVTVVVTDGYGSSDTRTLPVSVAPEQPPIIEELRITADHCYLKESFAGFYVGKEQMYDIECVVADTGMELFYEWSCTGGEISGEGSMIAWTAPDMSAKVTIAVIVSDIAGNMASRNLVLTVVSCSACTFGC